MGKYSYPLFDLSLTLDKVFYVCYCFFMEGPTGVLDKPPIIGVNGSKGALEGPTYNSSLGEKLSADMNRGAERRRATGEKISGFFSSMKKNLNRGVDAVFAAPNIAGTLGGEVKAFASETASLSKDALVAGKNNVFEAGLRANNNIVDARDRWVLRAQEAGNKVRERVKETGNAARFKTIELSKKAAVWGLANVAVPLERSAQAICQIPAEFNQWQGDSAEKRAQGLTAKAMVESTKGEMRAAALRTEADRVDREAQNRFASMGSSQEAANRKALELKVKASEKRARVGRVFGKSKVLVAALQTA